MLAANRSPPMWEISQVSAGCEAVSAAATGRPFSAQQASCRPCVQTPNNGPSIRGQSGASPRAMASRSSRSQLFGILVGGHEQQAESRKGEEHPVLRSAVGPVVATRQQDLDVLVRRQVGLDRVRQPAVTRGAGTPGPVVLDQEERGHMGGGPGQVLEAPLGGRGAAELATGRTTVVPPVIPPVIPVSGRPREDPHGSGVGTAPARTPGRGPGPPG